MVKVFLHHGRLSWRKDFMLQMIKIGTDSKYFHAGAQYPRDHKLLVESTSRRGVDIRPLYTYNRLILERGRKIDVYECLEEIDEDGFADWLLRQEDKKYGKRKVIYLAWLKISAQRGKANKYQKDEDFFCSDLLIKGLRQYAISKNAFQDIPHASVASPADIARSKSFRLLGPLR